MNSYELIFDNDKYWERLIELAQGDDWNKCVVESFGLWCYGGDVNDFLRALNNSDRKVEIIIGLDQRVHPGTEATLLKKLEHYLDIADTYYNIKWFFVVDSHAKYAAFDNGYYVIGGRNLTNSGWRDFNSIMHCPEAAEMLFREAKKIKTQKFNLRTVVANLGKTALKRKIEDYERR